MSKLNGIPVEVEAEARAATSAGAATLAAAT